MIRGLLKKEFELVGRSSSGIVSVLVLIFSFVFIFHYAIEEYLTRDIPGLEFFYIGMKWAFLFIISFIFIGQSVWEEREGGAIHINEMFLQPWIVFLVKSFVIFIVLFTLSFFLQAIFFLFFEHYQLDGNVIKSHIIFMGPGLLALSFLGVMLGLISISSRMKEIILPLLLIPFSIPVFMFGLGAEKQYMVSQENFLVSFIILSALSVFYGAMGAFMYEVINE